MHFLFNNKHKTVLVYIDLYVILFEHIYANGCAETTKLTSQKHVQN